MDVRLRLGSSVLLVLMKTKPSPLAHRHLSQKMSQQAKTKLGAWGEARARQFLLESGYQIWDSNVRYKNHEIDLVVFDAQTQEVVFVEVKTRASDKSGHASEAVDAKKLRSLQAVAVNYLRTMGVVRSYRFDIITVIKGKIEHFENVSW